MVPKMAYFRFHRSCGLMVTKMRVGFARAVASSSLVFDAQSRPPSSKRSFGANSRGREYAGSRPGLQAPV